MIEGRGPASAAPHARPLILTLVLAAFLLLPSMASVGMFVDGIMYAAISRNLAEGLGSMWAPHFSEGLFPVFHEHPPLVFWLQSLLFRVLGDSYLAERVYGLVAVFATALLIRVLWLVITGARGLEKLSAYWWLPLLLWVVVPKWSWAYRNNVLENTMTVFCLLSVLLVLGALRAPLAGRASIFAVAASGATLLAFLAKGPVGLFVLVSPVLLLPAVPGADWRRGVFVLAVVSAVFLGLLGVLLAWPEARAMLAEYWRDQVAGRAGISGADFGMLLELAKKVAPMLLVLAGLRLWVWRGAVAGWARGVLAPAAAMFAVGLSASLPLALGDLDSAHYLVPALPFLALGFGLIGALMLDRAEATVRTTLTRRPGRLFLLISGVAAAAIAIESAGRIGEVRKNEDYHVYLAHVADAAGERSALGVDAALYDDWYLHAIAQRHHRISLVSGLSNAEWRLAPAAQQPSPGYRATEVANGQWALLRRQAVP